MKLKPIILSASLMLILTAAGVRSAHAQSDEMQEANIPFAFYAGGEQLPAGAYYFALDVENDMVRVSDTAGRHQLFLLGIAKNDQGDTSALVFDHSGDSYVLMDLKSDVMDIGFPMRNTESANGNHLGSAQILVKMNHA
jgi:hypothetical protein